MHFVGYALSRLGEPQPEGSDLPPAWLKAETWAAAYDRFFPALGDGRSRTSFARSLKHVRDTCDPYQASGRRGWLTADGQPPTPKGWVKRVMETWSSRSDDEVHRAVMAILVRAPTSGGRMDHWPSVRARLEKMTRKIVSQSGKVQLRMLKRKELRCADLEATLDELLHRQGYRCRQTGVPFVEGDPELRASLDRIDSDGHYEDGTLGDGPHNLQLVTHWYNIAKGVRSDRDMLRLLALHTAGASATPPSGSGPTE